MAMNILTNGRAETFDSKSMKSSSSRSHYNCKKYEYSYFFKQKQHPLLINDYDQSSLTQKMVQLEASICNTNNNKPCQLFKEQRSTTDQQFEFQRQDRIRRFYSSKNSELDPRDERIKLRFKSQYYPTLVKKQFQAPIQPFQEELRDYLVDVIEICTSIGYNHLNRETMTEHQTKNFVAKNILENIKSIFEDHKQMPLEIRYRIMKFANKETFMIFDHIAKKYPQTRSRGVSKRLKSKVPIIDNRQSNQFDFLYRNNIEIQYRDDGDYSEDIMRIINNLISFSNEVYSENMELEDSNYEVFSDIMEYIFQNSTFQTPEAITQEIERTICKKQRKIDKKVNNVLSAIIPDGEAEDDESTSIDTERIKRIKDFQKQVIIGQKIPSGVRLFSEEDIKASEFKVHDSSILRLLTKWAEQLRNKIMNAEESIYRRRFKFKGAKGKLINLQPQLKQHLYKAAIDQMKKIQEQLKIQKDDNYYLQTIFAEEYKIGKYSKHDTNVCSYAAKVNQIASQHIFKYISVLIHALLTIPRAAAQKVESDREKTVIESINLVTFKIGDMMRCKCSCSEYQFLKILKVVDSLTMTCPDILKISRIKNRLQTENNDILINFFFGNKAECELQLSVMSLENKQEKNSSKFSHLIYEIVRAELGPLSEMATIIVQYDPLAQYYSKQQCFCPQDIKIKKKIKGTRHQKNPKQRLAFRKKFNIGDSIESPFICCTCQNLSIVHNPQFYYRNLDQPKRVCNKCLVKSFTYSSINFGNLREHVLSQNFPDDPEMMTFFHNHVKLWDSESFVNDLKNESEEKISNSWFPPRGFVIRFNQKKTKMELFTCIYESTYSTVIFANKDSNGQKKIIFSIKIHEEKDKKIKNIEKQLKKFAIFELYDSSQVQQGSERFFACNKPDCCGIKINPGPILAREQMEEFIDNKMITKSVESQRDLLYLNYMPNSLQKLESHLNTVKEKNKIWKVRNTVVNIEAYQCKLENIKIISLFSKLQDLNIGANPQLTSLAGIEHCHNLKYINCSDCDLQHINELADLKKLETLNLTNNRRLKDIEVLKDHPELQDLFIRNTKVNTLAPLESCLKLESLDLQGCQQITSIKEVKSPRLNYISIVNCFGIETFDLPQSTLKSLRTVELSKDRELAHAMSGFLQKLIGCTSSNEKNISRRNSDVFDDQTINKINEVLKIRKTNSLITFIDNDQT